MDTHRLNQFPDSVKTPIGWIGYRYDSFFYSFAKIKIIVSPEKIITKENEEFDLHCRVEIPSDYLSFIQKHSALNITTRIAIFKKGEWVKDVFILLSLQDMIEKKKIDIKINPALSKGNYSIKFALQTENNLPTHNSERIPLVIE
jgi:hypothetical protein